MARQSSEVQSILERLSKVERQNCQLKWSALVFVTGIAAVFLMGQASIFRAQEVIEAEKFVLRDKNGRQRALLGVGSDDSVSLTFAGQGQTPALGLIVSQELSGLALYGSDIQPHVTLSVSKQGNGLFIDAQGGKPGAVLGVMPDGSPSLAIYGKRDQPLVALGLRADGLPSVALNRLSGKGSSVLSPNGLGVSGDDGNTRIGLAVMSDGSSNMVLFDKNGKVKWRTP